MIALSEENILNFPVDRIDTWPYLPRGLISEGQEDKELGRRNMDRVMKESEDSFSELERVIKEFVSRQRTIISWILAVFAGVAGNFVVNVLFGSLNFQVSDLSLILLIVGSIIFAVLIFIIFLYYPTRLSYRIVFIPPFEYPQPFKPVINEDKLKLKAKILVQVDPTFHDLIVRYTNLISLAILRDELKKVGMRIVKVSELRELASGYPYFRIEIELKQRRMFWHPKVASKARSELILVNDALTRTKIQIGVHSVDRNKERWKNKGHVFLNEISQWNMEETMQKIKEQIMS